MAAWPRTNGRVWILALVAAAAIVQAPAPARAQERTRVAPNPGEPPSQPTPPPPPAAASEPQPSPPAATQPAPTPATSPTPTPGAAPAPAPPPAPAPGPGSAPPPALLPTTPIPQAVAPPPAPALDEPIALPPPPPGAAGEPARSTTPTPTPSTAAEDGKEIVAVHVYENTRTDSETVIALGGLDVGDTWTAADGAQAKTNLLSSGLFKDAEVWAVAQGDGVAVNYVVHDKFSWVIAPTFSYGPGNLGGGLLYGENNLFGRNKKLLLYGNLSTADSHLIAGYLDPNLFGTPWLFMRLDGSVVRDYTVEYDPADIHVAHPAVIRRTPITQVGGGFRLGINWFRAFKTDAWLRGAHLWIGNPSGDLARVDVNQNGQIDRPEGPASAAEVTLRLGAAYDRQANIDGVLIGPNLEVAYEQALPSLGSDYRFHEYTLSGTYGIRFFEQTNLVLRTWDAVGEDLPFHEEFVAGGGNLRGYIYRQLRGDREVQASADFIFPLFHIGPLYFRGDTFYDGAAVWYGGGTIPADHIAERSDGSYRAFPSDACNGFHLQADARSGCASDMGDDVGIGLRLYLKSIVLPLLGVDFARGVENGAWQLVLSIGVS